jgi:hypothetical protein
MGIRFDNNGQQGFIFIMIITMMAALFVSRVALSFSLFFLAAMMLRNELTQPLHNFFKSSWPAGKPLLFFLPCVSFLRSANVRGRSGLVRIQSLLLLPVAFAGSFLFDIVLVMQYGVFVYAFLLWWKWFFHTPQTAAA